MLLRIAAVAHWADLARLRAWDRTVVTSLPPDKYIATLTLARRSLACEIVRECSMRDGDAGQEGVTLIETVRAEGATSAASMVVAKCRVGDCTRSTSLKVERATAAAPRVAAS